jgi:hypothetical protein
MVALVYLVASLPAFIGSDANQCARSFCGTHMEIKDSPGLQGVC